MVWERSVWSLISVTFDREVAPEDWATPRLVNAANIDVLPNIAGSLRQRFRADTWRVIANPLTHVLSSELRQLSPSKGLVRVWQRNWTWMKHS
jgi:hypothetical protein